MTKKTSQRTAVVVDTGSKTSAAVSAARMAPTLKNGSIPREVWTNVKKEDIGAGYEVVESLETTTEESVRAKNERDDPIWKNQFIRGSSPMIWYMIRPKIAAKDRPTVKVREPVNFQNKLDKKTAKKFSSSLGSSIEQTANFMVKELLPRTLAINSGLNRAEELIQQLVDDKVALPLGYLHGKVTTAMHLRIIRFVSNLFELTAEEKKLMVAEFYRSWGES